MVVSSITYRKQSNILIIGSLLIYKDCHPPQPHRLTLPIGTRFILTKRW
jgi:hypothetical protein